MDGIDGIQWYSMGGGRLFLIYIYNIHSFIVDIYIYITVYIHIENHCYMNILYHLLSFLSPANKQLGPRSCFGFCVTLISKASAQLKSGAKEDVSVAKLHK